MNAVVGTMNALAKKIYVITKIMDAITMTGN